MTTHDEQTNTTTTPTADDDSAARQEYSSPGTEPATAQPRQSAAAEPSSATMRTDPPTADDDSAARQEYSSAGTEPATAQPRQSARRSRAVPRTTSPDGTDPPAAATTEPIGTTETTGISTDQSRTNSLFADDTSGLRSRWDDVQAAFVDDPKECVQKADTLVAEVVEQLTNGFSEARSRLEAQWSRGEEASTEDLRLALKRYREFFQRLLSV